jgi:hypothetical protein
MKVTIKILAEDIKNSNFHIAHDCAITIALRRANINGREIGGSIRDVSNNYITHTPHELLRKVLGMYYFDHELEVDVNDNLRPYIVPPEDFEFELDIPDEYVKQAPIMGMRY